MQAIFGVNKEAVDAFRATMSEARFSRYLKEAAGDPVLAIQLYYWNSQLSQSLYVLLQAWEVALRNRLNSFLIWKFNAQWPYDEQRAVRTLKRNEQRRLQEAVERQELSRGKRPVGTDAIVADLSAGFWVALLSTHYIMHLSWKYNLRRVFPNDAQLTQGDAWALCEKLLDLRNRVAHHEPIFHLPLVDLHEALGRLIGGMCPATLAYVERACTFAEVMKANPLAATEAPAAQETQAAGPNAGAEPGEVAA